MAGAMGKVKSQYKILILTGTAVMLIWCIDALYDSFIAQEGPFFEILTNVAAHEPFLRAFMTLCFLAFGIIISMILAKQSKAEAALKKHSAAIEMSMDGIAVYSSEGHYVYVNQSYAEINGYADTAELIGKSFRDVYDERELERMDQVCIPTLKRTGRWRGELIAKRKNGSTYFQEASVTMLEDGGRVCIIRDITWRKRSEERMRRSERFLNTIFDSIRDPFCIFDREYQVIRVNDAYAQLKNVPVDALIGRKCHEVLHNSMSVCEGCVVDKTFQSSDPCAKDKLIVMPDGTEIWIEIYTYPILDDDGKVSHVMEYTRDITDRRKSETEKRRLIERLEHLSRTDSLTGLINRRALTDSLAYELDRAKRYDSELSLILCDIDNFKEINDTYGHDAGDRALQTVSATLKTILRKTDIAGRYGGDEFMLILPETALAGAESLAEKLLSTMRDADLWLEDAKNERLSMSIGIARFEPSRDSIDSLIKRADDGMYLSKQSGRNRISSVNP